MPIDRLKYALEAAEVGLWDWNVLTGELWWSDNLAAIHGIEPTAFDGTFERFLSIIHPADRSNFDGALARAVASGGNFAAEFRVVGTDGEVRWIRGQGRVFRNASGEPVRVIGVADDVSSRRVQEHAARQLGLIADASTDAIIAVNASGMVTAWNPAAATLYGFTADEMIGMPIGLIAPSERSSEIEQILGQLSRGEHVANFETERIRKDGTRIIISMSSGPLFENSGQWAGAVTIARNITLRRREEDRQRLRAEAGSVLNTTLDAEATLSAVAALVVRHIADWCIVHVLQSEGIVSRVAVAQSAERLGAVVPERPRFKINPDARTGVAGVLLTGRPVVFENITDAQLRSTVDDPELMVAMKGIGISSAMIVPMVARDNTIGAISFYTAEPGRHYTSDDVALASELARRSALAVDNAMLFARVRAAEQQLRLVADTLPALVSYVDTEGRYRFVNKRYSEYIGIDGEALLGRRLRDVLKAEEIAQVDPHLQAALSGEAAHYEMEISYPGVGRRLVEIEYVPDEGADGDIRGVVALIVDMTERSRVQRRTSRLYELTASLAGAVTEDDVARCMVRHGIEALDGIAGIVAALDPDGLHLTLRAVQGYPAQVQTGNQIPVEAETSVGIVTRSGEPILLRSRQERLSRLPHQAQLGDDLLRGGFACMPLAVDGRMLGAFVIVFPEPREFDQGDIDFLVTLANLCAQSLDRARVYDAELRARGAAESERARVAFLAEASKLLAGSLDTAAELKRVMAVAAGFLCDWCTVHLIDEEGSLRRLGVVHRDPSKYEVGRALERTYDVLPPTSWRSVRAVLGDGRPWFDPVVSASRLDAESLDAGHLELLKALGFAGEMVVPMVAGGRMVGSMTFVRGPESNPFVKDDLDLAEELARRIALALDNARLFTGAQASEARYRTLFEEAADAILVVDSSAIIRDGNDAAAALLDVERERLVDLPVRAIVTAPDAADGAESVPVFLQDSWQGDLLATRRNGTSIPVDVHTTLVELPGGPAFLVVLRDTSERRTLERLQRDFLAMVTHDLRSPLAAIRVQAQLMQRRARFSDEGVRAIIGQTDRMAKLINSLADVVRMDSGRLDLNLQRLDLVELAQGVVAQERVNARAHSFAVRASGPVFGEWDGDRLSQVISNLVGNAVKYSSAGTEVVVEVVDRGDDAAVTVMDAGVGIAADHVPKLFERFYRADVTGAGGLGLGRYIARMLTDAHGGRILVESTPGRGSSFTVVLPKGATQ